MRLVNSVWNKEELPDYWKESVIVPVCKKNDETECSNYRGRSLFSATYKILSYIPLLRLTPYAGNYWGLSVWILRERGGEGERGRGEREINYRYVLHA